MAEGKRVAVRVNVLVRRGSEILLMRRPHAPDAGTWKAPGGHMEFGETPEECGRREIREETGVEVGELRFRGLTNDFDLAQAKHSITIWMEAPYASGEPALNAPKESDAIGWFDLDHLPEALYPRLANFLQGNLYVCD